MKLVYLLRTNLVWLSEVQNIVAGLVLWEQTRQEWTEIRSLRPKVKQVREPVLRYERMKC